MEPLPAPLLRRQTESDPLHGAVGEALHDATVTLWRGDRVAPSSYNQKAGRCANSPGHAPNLVRGPKMAERTCSIPGCGRTQQYLTRGWCRKHYSTWQRRGDPTWTRPSIAERFAAKVTKTEGCWLFTGQIDRGGYGLFWYEDRLRGAHRVSYELYVGPIPDGLHLDHLCRNRACVNPAHLEPVTNRENTLRGILPNKLKTHCKWGHPYSEENTWTDPKTGWRQCRTCNRARDRKRQRAS
jgi:hypothetical protein